MRSAATFLALMATGVLIVMIYIWSGESIAALIMAIVTMFAVVAILEWRPWAIEGDNPVRSFTARHGRFGRTARRESDGGEARSRPAGLRRGRGGDAGSGYEEAVWRGRFDVTWDRRGVSGVALGKQAPQLWSWSQIDDISLAWCNDEQPSLRKTEQDEGGSGRDETTEHDLGDAPERLGLCLDFPSLRDPEEPAQAQIMLGPEQDPDELLRDVRSAWRDAKVPRSRLFDLSAEERTRKLMEYFGRGADEAGDSSTIDLTPRSASPELLYQEIRRALLSSGELCRLASDATFDDVLDGFDALLEANGTDPLSRTEADELAAADGPNRVASLHWTLDWVAEQRGFRVAFIDQGGGDYLIGLVPANAADDWDGQTVGSGSARVVLDLPS